MGNLFVDTDRERLEQRIRSLTPSSQRRWGKMDLPKALSHMGDQLALALGELQAAPLLTPLRLPLFKHLAIYFLPTPKNVKTAPELLETDLQDLEEARSRLLELIDRFVDQGHEASWCAHPLFGKLSGKDWGTLAHRHLDHHLKQFSA